MAATMRFVMVPVPAEHVREVIDIVLFATPEGDAAAIRDRAKIRRLLGNSSARTRSLLQAVAHASLAGAELTVASAAEALDEDEAAIHAMLLDLRARVLNPNLSLVTLREEADGEPGKGAALLTMEPERAEVVLLTLEHLGSSGE
jgi:hypothetical protein